MLRLAEQLLGNYDDIMLLADRGFANHELMNWLQDSSWHYCLRLPCDVHLHGPRRHPIELMYLWPPKGEALFYHNVGLWLDGLCRCHIVLANVKGVKEPWQGYLILWEDIREIARKELIEQLLSLYCLIVRR